MNKYYVSLERTDQQGNKTVISVLGFSYGYASGLYLKNIEPKKYDYSILKIKEIKKDER
jgi:hypothetical protein